MGQENSAYTWCSLTFKGEWKLNLKDCHDGWYNIPITWSDIPFPCHIKSCGLYFMLNSNMTSFFRFVDKRTIYRCHNLIRTCAGECDWLFHWQHKLCATFSSNVNLNYRLPIKVYYRICTLRHIRIEINHGSQNVFWVLTWIGGY